MKTDTNAYTEIVLASRNRHKIREIQEILERLGLGDIRLLSLDDIGITEDIEENGSTFEENALLKASVPAKAGYFGMADDSGLAVDALGGAPGIYSARYAVPHDDKANNRRLLADMAGKEDRTARFVCAVALTAPGDTPGTVGKTLTLRGECVGQLLTEERGASGFGYDPLFYVPSEGMTFAELSAERKNQISHRFRAFAALAGVLPDFIHERK